MRPGRGSGNHQGRRCPDAWSTRWYRGDSLLTCSRRQHAFADLDRHGCARAGREPVRLCDVRRETPATTSRTTRDCRAYRTARSRRPPADARRRRHDVRAPLADTNDLASRAQRLDQDRRFHYMIGYMPLKAQLCGFPLTVDFASTNCQFAAARNRCRIAGAPEAHAARRCQRRPKI
jgi:hypothetical protein